jgi:hypothetical protein
MKRVILALSLFLLSSAQAATEKNYNLQFEALRVGVGLSFVNNGSSGVWSNIGLGALTFSYYRVRFGTALLGSVPEGFSPLPVEGGITIYQHPKPYACFRGMVPDVYVVVGYYPFVNGGIDEPFGPVWKYGVRCEGDYWGVGAGLEVAYVHETENVYRGRHPHGIAASLYLRLLTTNFGF